MRNAWKIGKFEAKFLLIGTFSQIGGGKKD